LALNPAQGNCHEPEKRDNDMATIQPEGENLRKAVKWISDERKFGPEKKPAKLIEEACFKFNLSPANAEYLAKFVRQEGTAD